MITIWRALAAAALLSACGDAKDTEDTTPPTDGTVTDETEEVPCVSDEVPYDGVDNDCDPATPDDDLDADGAARADDCDDADPTRWNGADDAVGDGIDQGCDGVDGVDADADGVASIPSGGLDCDDTDPAARYALASVDPVQGEIPFETVFTATFTGDGTGATVTLTGPDGAVPGTTTQSGASGEFLTFLPDAPLAADATFTLTVDGACGSTSIPYTTPDPFLDPAAMVGSTLSIDWLDGVVVSPVALGPLLPALGIESELLVAFVDPATGRVVASDLGVPPAQLPCAVTSDGAITQTGDYTGAFAAVTAAADVEGSPVALENLELTFSSHDGGLTLDPVRFSAAVRMHGFDAYLGGGDTCALIATFGVHCGACPVSGGSDCVPLEVTGFGFAQYGNVSVGVRTAADVLADPACQ